jgi:hypothetical protein
MFKVIAFYQVIEFYCTKNSMGGYKYPQQISNTTVYLTYEANSFFKQSKFDEYFTLFESLYPANIWVNSRGEALNFKKRYSPVIDKNKKRKNYPFGFGKN